MKDRYEESHGGGKKGIIAIRVNQIRKNAGSIKGGKSEEGDSNLRKGVGDGEWKETCARMVWRRGGLK